MNAADGFAEEFGDGYDRHVGKSMLSGDRTGVGHDDAVHACSLKSFNGRAAEYRMSRAEEDASRAAGSNGFNRAADGAGCRDHVIEDQRCLAFEGATDDVRLLGLQRVRSAFVDDGQRPAEMLFVLQSSLDAAFIRTHDDKIFVGNHHRLKMLIQNRRGVKMIHRHVEEALDLRGMKIHRQHSMRAGSDDQICDQLRCDRYSTGILSILSSISEIRDHRGDSRRTGSAAGINDHQQLDEIFIHRRAGRLNDENVTAADVLIQLDADFAVRKVPDVDVTEADSKIRGNLSRQLWVRSTTEDRQMLVHGFSRLAEFQSFHRGNWIPFAFSKPHDIPAEGDEMTAGRENCKIPALRRKSDS